MTDVRYTKDHEWIRLDGDVATVGITDYAQSQLGDIVFVEVPDEEKSVSKGGEAAVVESVKAANEVYAPVSGTVIEGNATLGNEPDKMNSDPTGNGWLFKMTLSDVAELDDLMDQAAYDAYLAELDA